jgi:hypothetical protein
VQLRRLFGPAIGAAVMAGVLGAGAVIVPSFATTSSGDRAIFEPLAPARILNTRPNGPPVGGTTGPIANGQSFDLQVTGAGGVPADATAVVMNVTYADAAADGFITVWPAGAARPNASNLNTVKNGPPTPNLVTVQLGAGGRISLYNFGGNVNLIGDVAGYYRGHDHDDRYYSKAQVDALGPKSAEVSIDASAVDIIAVTPTKAVQFTFNAPSAGTLVMSTDFTLFMGFSSGADQGTGGRVGLCTQPDSSTTCGGTWQLHIAVDPSALTTGGIAESTTLSRVIQVAAPGPVTTYLNMAATVGLDIAPNDFVHATALFFPNGTASAVTAAGDVALLVGEVVAPASSAGARRRS